MGLFHEMVKRCGGKKEKRPMTYCREKVRSASEGAVFGSKEKGNSFEFEK